MSETAFQQVVRETSNDKQFARADFFLLVELIRNLPGIPADKVASLMGLLTRAAIRAGPTKKERALLLAEMELALGMHGKTQ